MSGSGFQLSVVSSQFGASYSIFVPSQRAQAAKWRTNIVFAGTCPAAWYSNGQPRLPSLGILDGQTHECGDLVRDTTMREADRAERWNPKNDSRMDVADYPVNKDFNPWRLSMRCKMITAQDLQFAKRVFTRPNSTSSSAARQKRLVDKNHAIEPRYVFFRDSTKESPN